MNVKILTLTLMLLMSLLSFGGADTAMGQGGGAREHHIRLRRKPQHGRLHLTMVTPTPQVQAHAFTPSTTAARVLYTPTVPHISGPMASVEQGKGVDVGNLRRLVQQSPARSAQSHRAAGWRRRRPRPRLSHKGPMPF